MSVKQIINVYGDCLTKDQIKQLKAIAPFKAKTITLREWTNEYWEKRRKKKWDEEVAKTISIKKVLKAIKHETTTPLSNASNL